ncbi:MAG: hypothetical protein HY549_05500 [Elusimicrobia bacterium]|nr:hypothetical protein [Elusimicrobiota bacterium]
MERLAILAIALGAGLGLNGALRRLNPAPVDSAGITLAHGSAVENAALFSLGMRRLAADLGLIRLLIYYGTPEDHHGHHTVAEHFGSGHYPELGPRAMRILDLDPSFSYAPIYSAGALAFNLDRPEEALAVLRHALSRDPGNPEYHRYAGAIGFHKKGDPRKVLELLEPALENEATPTMIKHLAAFLFERSGQRERAVSIYREIAQASRDEGYRRMAQEALRRLGAEL